MTSEVSPGGADRVAVVVATVGRADLLPALLEALRRQTLAPVRIVFVGAAREDVASVEGAGQEVRALIAPRGSCTQRNRGLSEVEGCADVVVFFDDDFVPTRFWLQHCVDIFARYPDVRWLTGTVVADGVMGPGLSLSEARQAVNAKEAAGGTKEALRIYDYGAPYGCNMAFRATAISGLRFDERLPLYGWQEDRDFGFLAKRDGRGVKVDGIYGAHMGVKRGRTSGKRLGVSQVVNPVYLSLKGTVPWKMTIRLMSGNLAANLLKAFRPEAYIDRRGRLLGNLIGLSMVARGRIEPECVLKL